MLLTPEEKREFQWDMNMAGKIITKWAKKIDGCTTLGIPGQFPDEDGRCDQPEIEHVGYDAEQCARNK